VVTSPGAFTLRVLRAFRANTVLENAMSVIFLHRVATRRRHFLVSAVIPYCYIVFLGMGLLLMTLVSGSLQAVGAESIDFLGRSWSLRGVSGALLYLLGVMLPCCCSVPRSSPSTSASARKVRMRLRDPCGHDATPHAAFARKCDRPHQVVSIGSDRGTSAGAQGARAPAACHSVGG
jgi:hypothetical protein